MVEAGRLRVAGLSQVEVRQVSLEECDAAPGGFDRVVCHQVFPHFDDQPAALARLASLLKPGGVLVIVHFVSATEINDTHRKAGTVIEGDLLPPADQMRRLIAQAGLSLEAFADDDLGYFLKARKNR
jgi:demethylmenaquinone methyltransferase/2-methoxy-6-polyprenyl-1,4-benzoquinol methylase